MSRNQVVEAQAGVNGQALGLGLIDQSDAVEVVLQLLTQHSGIIAQVLAQEVVVTPVLLVLTHETDSVVRVLGVKAHHVDTFLLGTPVVVLGFHLQEVETRVHIRADAKLLAPGMTVLVNDIHVVVGRVEIGSIIGRNALTVNILRAIIITGKCQQQLQPVNRCDKLGVGTVHQLDAAHLIKGNRVICPDYGLHRTAKLNIFSEKQAYGLFKFF